MSSSFLLARCLLPSLLLASLSLSVFVSFLDGMRERLNKCLGSVVRSRKSLFAHKCTYFVGCSVFVLVVWRSLSGVFLRLLYFLSLLVVFLVVRVSFYLFYDCIRLRLRLWLRLCVFDSECEMKISHNG